MKTWLRCFLAVTSILALSAAVCAADDIKTHASCSYCGMNRETFAHSRMLVEYDDGTLVGVCSLHCAAVDLVLNIDKTPKKISVGDFKSKNLIDAEKVFWVVGGSKPGVMTKNAKWAFETKEEAEKFVQENGGKFATFDQALNMAYQDISDDTKMIRERRKMRMMKEHKME
jgi:copper chaperone NosL